MNNTIIETKFNFPNQTKFYRGKIRDVYYIQDEILVMIATDRISAFDTVLPKGIPYKGQVLNQIADSFLDLTSNIIPNWKLTSPDPMVTIGRLCEPFKVEMVIRGYLSGHAWREYKLGKRTICGVSMPEGMKENDKFPHPIITPTTKATVGHDEDISREEILNQGLVSEEDYVYLEEKTLELFNAGTEFAKDKGLILVDTKYEFGYDKNGTITLIDEIHTPDSSRYFYLNTYDELQYKSHKQRQLSKEFFREWLMENNFRGLENQTVPNINEDVINMVSTRYIELYEKLIGEKFDFPSNNNIIERIQNNLKDFLK